MGSAAARRAANCGQLRPNRGQRPHDPATCGGRAPPLTWAGTLVQACGGQTTRQPDLHGQPRPALPNPSEPAPPHQPDPNTATLRNHIASTRHDTQPHPPPTLLTASLDRSATWPPSRPSPGLRLAPGDRGHLADVLGPSPGLRLSPGDRGHLAAIEALARAEARTGRPRPPGRRVGALARAEALTGRPRSPGRRVGAAAG